MCGGFSDASAGRLRCFDVCDISLPLRRAACAAPPGVAFRLCWCKVPRPRRSADADLLVKPFSRVLVPGISPCPCVCCASAPSQPRHFVTAPFRGKPAPAVPSPGVSAASMSATSRCRAACGPGAKMSLAYATGPFSVPNCPARPSRTTEDLILYGAVGCAATVPHRAHC